MQDRQSNMIAEKREAVKGFLPWLSKRRVAVQYIGNSRHTKENPTVVR